MYYDQTIPPCKVEQVNGKIRISVPHGEVGTLTTPSGEQVVLKLPKRVDISDGISKREAKKILKRAKRKQCRKLRKRSRRACRKALSKLYRRFRAGKIDQRQFLIAMGALKLVDAEIKKDADSYAYFDDDYASFVYDEEYDDDDDDYDFDDDDDEYDDLSYDYFIDKLIGSEDKYVDKLKKCERRVNRRMGVINRAINDGQSTNLVNNVGNPTNEPVDLFLNNVMGISTDADSYAHFEYDHDQCFDSAANWVSFVYDSDEDDDLSHDYFIGSLVSGIASAVSGVGNPFSNNDGGSKQSYKNCKRSLRKLNRRLARIGMDALKHGYKSPRVDKELARFGYSN